MPNRRGVIPGLTRMRDLARRFAGLSCTNVLDVLRELGYVRVYMEGVRSLIPGPKMAGRAVTVRFLPERPDLAASLRRMGLTPLVERSLGRNGGTQPRRLR